MLNKNPYAAYTQSALETEVMVASPHKLILMLFDGAIQAIANARRFLQEKNIPEKGRMISKAIAIVDEGLRLSLNKEVGGELAEQLDALYEYVSNTLLEANLNNDDDKLEQASRLLGELRDAWEQISPTRQAAENSTEPPPRAKPMSYGNV